MSCRFLLLSLVAGLMVVAAETSPSHAQSKKDSPSKTDSPSAPARATHPTPAVSDEFVQKQFGENCSLIQGPPQFVADLDGDGVDDLLVAAKCRNPIADQAEYSFKVIDPYNSFLGFGDVKVTSTFASDEPERRGLSLLIIHGTGSDAWRAEKPKAKFLLINLPFKTLAVKKVALKKKTILGVYMEERGEGENTSSVIFWDGKKYRYQMLGSDLE
jgi:hypothetical protein